MRTRIGTRVILGVGVVTALTIGVMAAIIVSAHQADLIAELTRGANQLSETIKSSTYDDMLENRRDNLHRRIVAIGRQEGIEKVRLFNKEGRIMFSSDAGDIGRLVDKQTEACYACHAVDRPLEKLDIPARARIFGDSSEHRVLGIINPIHNQPNCSTAACHAHRPGEAVLGILDITVSLAQVDREIAKSQVRMVGLAALAIAAGSLILWWLNRKLVLEPVEALAAGTRRVAAGDLATKIPVMARHELGELAIAFNEMIARLSEAQRQLTQADKLASVGRLAAGVAHEINNPLTGVLTYASFLLKRAEANPELQADLQVIVRETKRCREIVKGLLDFSRTTPPKRQPTDINEVARRAVAIVMNQLTLNRVSLALDLAVDLPTLQADPNQMQQVLVNLLVNAADANDSTDSKAEKGGTIRLESRRTALPPWGHAAIRRAACPKGCDLIDPAVRIGGVPAIRVSRSCRGQERPVHLDPVYGRFNHLVAEPFEDGEDGIEASFNCPRCRTSLVAAERRCGRCGGKVFGIEVPGDGRVEWCTRVGCHWARWETMESQGEQPAVELVIEDSGRGIPAEDLRHLFEPFFSTKGSRGTGLGLAVTWGIVESHGGTIEVESVEGKGSRFTVHLPIEPVDRATGPIAAGPALAEGAVHA